MKWTTSSEQIVGLCAQLSKTLADLGLLLYGEGTFAQLLVGKRLHVELGEERVAHCLAPLRELQGGGEAHQLHRLLSLSQEAGLGLGVAHGEEGEGVELAAQIESIV
jgi:hypothetical protein